MTQSGRPGMNRRRPGIGADDWARDSWPILPLKSNRKN
jgi:hypothetical protein